MPDLEFAVTGAAATPFAAVPTLTFGLSITEVGSEPIEAVALQCQIRIEATRRRYNPGEKARLSDLFGTPDRWSQTLRTFLWTHTATNVQPFSGSTTAELRIPCTFDFEVVATKYLDALEEGELPLLFLFSGTIFFRDHQGALQVGQISWEREASYRLPVGVWKELMQLYYPNAAWLYLRRDIFDRLLRFKIEHGIPTLEGAVERLLGAVPEVTRP